MERDAFVNVKEPWWFLEAELENQSQLADLRRQIGQDLGWEQQWYTDQAHLEELHRGLESRQPTLLTDLDQVNGETNQLTWLTAVRGVTSAAGSGAAAAAVPAADTTAAETSADQGTWDENWQMLVRTGAGQEYQFAFSDDRVSIRPGTSWMSSEEATAAKQAAHTTPAAAADGAAPAAQSAAASAAAAAAASGDTTQPTQEEISWDANWGMFLRRVDGNYQYALSNLLGDGPGTQAPAGQPDGTWHDSTDAAGQARQQAAQIKETFSDLVADPEVAISQEDLDAALQDPNFQQNLASAEAALEAELAALESEG